jgi:hypothetical protein
MQRFRKILHTNFGATDKRQKYLSFGKHVYEDLVEDFFEKDISLLEVGTRGGESLLLWEQCFPNATIYGIDTGDNPRFKPVNSDRINLIIGDGYDKSTFPTGRKLDIVIDDGSHQIKDMKKFINIYAPLLNSKGALIIEDIPKPEWIPELKDVLEKFPFKKISALDLRHIQNRWDDIIIIAKK